MTSIFNDFTNTQPQIQQSQNVQNQATKPIAVKEVMPQQEAKPDTVELSNKKTKKGPVKAVKGFIANIKKFFATVGEYTKGNASFRLSICDSHTLDVFDAQMIKKNFEPSKSLKIAKAIEIGKLLPFLLNIPLPCRTIRSPLIWKSAAEK